MTEAVFFESALQFRTWLSENAASAIEISVGYHKVATGRPSLTWPDSVDEALCYGWIDGARRRIDEHRYKIRFTPRKTSSIWSAINIAKVAKLREEGRMTQAGETAYACRTLEKSAVYAHEQAGLAELTLDEWEILKKDVAGWQYFESCPAGYRKRMQHWIASAKLAATRSARLTQLNAACVARKRLPPK